MDVSLNRLTYKKSALHRVQNRLSGARFSYICISDSIRKYVSSISTLASFGVPFIIPMTYRIRSGFSFFSLLIYSSQSFIR